MVIDCQFNYDMIMTAPCTIKNISLTNVFSCNNIESMHGQQLFTICGYNLYVVFLYIVLVCDCFFTPREQFFQIYHEVNNLLFDGIMMISVSY